MIRGMQAVERKVTVHLPSDLLDRAQKATGEGITETVRQGLELVAARETFRRASIKFTLNLARLRDGRS